MNRIATCSARVPRTAVLVLEMLLWLGVTLIVGLVIAAVNAGMDHFSPSTSGFN